jgi:hypothetical protein
LLSPSITNDYKAKKKVRMSDLKIANHFGVGHFIAISTIASPKFRGIIVNINV